MAGAGVDELLGAEAAGEVGLLVGEDVVLGGDEEGGGQAGELLEGRGTVAGGGVGAVAVDEDPKSRVGNRVVTA